MFVRASVTFAAYAVPTAGAASVLDCIPDLIRVATLERDDPLRAEWLRAMRE